MARGIKCGWVARCKVVRQGTLVLKLTVHSPLKPFHTFLLSLFLLFKNPNQSFFSGQSLNHSISHYSLSSLFLNFHTIAISIPLIVIITFPITFFLSYLSFLRSTRQFFGFHACRLGS